MDINQKFCKKLGMFQGPAPAPALNLKKTLIIPSITLVTNFDNNFNGFSNNFDNNLRIIYSHYLYKYKLIRTTFYINIINSSFNNSFIKTLQTIKILGIQLKMFQLKICKKLMASYLKKILLVLERVNG